MDSKDYIKIAEILSNRRECYRGNRDNAITPPSEVLSDVAESLAIVFASDNPRFNQDKFLEACGL